MPQFALKWILTHEGVSTIIPGRKRPEQVEDNAKASQLPNLSHEVTSKVGEIYANYIKEHVHTRW